MSFHAATSTTSYFQSRSHYAIFERHLLPVTDLFAYCLLRNHFHFSVRIRSEDEIIETLRVSPVNPPPINSQAGRSNEQVEQPRKPLGSSCEEVLFVVE
jgi:hypothetical protein